MKNHQIINFWHRFLDSLPEENKDSYKDFSVWHFCDNEEDANALVELVVRGIKTATCSLLWSYETEGELPPSPGAISIITNWAGEPLCIIVTRDVKIVPFGEVKKDHARREGEGDKSLAYWRKAHWDVFSRECIKIGKEAKEDMPLVCEQFELIYLK